MVAVTARPTPVTTPMGLERETLRLLKTAKRKRNTDTQVDRSWKSNNQRPISGKEIYSTLAAMLDRAQTLAPDKALLR